jgi:hypothetical protein
LVRLNAGKLDFHVHLVGDRAFRTICDAVGTPDSLRDAWDIDVELTIANSSTPADIGGRRS